MFVRLVGIVLASTAASAAADQRVSIERDLPYAANDNPRQCLDLILPKDRLSDEPLPVIAYVHGGAWRHGDKSGRLNRLARYVETGRYAAISIGYRLSGEVIWPAQLDDCRAALRWVRANSERLNLDPDRIGLIGSSAGGHLVSMLGVTGFGESTGGPETLSSDARTNSDRVACVINFYGPSNFFAIGDHPSNIDRARDDSPEWQLLGGNLETAADAARDASPVTHATADDAPILIIHGTEDRLVPYPQAVELHEAIVQAGADATLITIKGGGHGRFEGPALNRLIESFLARHLHDESHLFPDQVLEVRQD